MKRLGRLGRGCLISAVLAASVPGGVHAADDERTGVLALLGLEAAEGNTTLGNGAGAIEATLLSAASVNEAGAIVAGLVNGRLAAERAGTRRVLVLTGTDTINRVSLETIRSRIAALHATGQGIVCPSTIEKDQLALPTTNYALSYGNIGELISLGRPHITAPDIAGALATTQTIGAVPVAVSDRLFSQALTLNARLTLDHGRNGPAGPASWRSPEGRWDWADAARPANFVIPSEALAAGSSPLFRNYQALMEHVAELRACGDAATVKPFLQQVDTYVGSLNAISDKSPLSPLAQAMQIDAAVTEANAANPPLILRIAVEQSGGTTVTRSSIFYTLGFPGAAIVGAGLLVSFRLVDPDSGSLVLVGVIRCAEPTRNIRSVARIVRESSDEADRRSRSRGASNRCTYIAGP